jgi:hypothetical protein
MEIQCGLIICLSFPYWDSYLIREFYLGLKTISTKIYGKTSASVKQWKCAFLEVYLIIIKFLIRMNQINMVGASRCGAGEAWKTKKDRGGRNQHRNSENHNIAFYTCTLMKNTAIISVKSSCIKHCGPTKTIK